MAGTYAEVRKGVPVIGAPAGVLDSNRFAETFWFMLCLVLFMILGPFAAPVALACVFSREVRGNSLSEPECAGD